MNNFTTNKKIVLFIALAIFSLRNSFSQEKPNIVLLFVDDYGWSDVGYRNDKFETPNIDKLKSDGTEFTRAYIATPTCSPSRASLLTGKEPVRMQMVRHIPGGNKLGFKEDRTEEEFHLWPKDPVQMPSRNWFPLEETTYAEVLKNYGYYNMFIGKWHLGSEKYHPIHQGFDAQYGTANAGHPKNYYQPYFNYDNPLAEFSKEDYLTDVLTDETERFIMNYDKQQPFMLTLWYYNVHGPHYGRKDFIEKFKAQGLNKKEANYAAMVAAMDESVGRVRNALKEKGIEDNTVIIFTSDQGGQFSNAPLSGGKLGGNTLGEGGSRVPFIIYYPNKTIAEFEINTPIQSLDIFPTLVEIASDKKYKNKNIQGQSLIPLIEHKKLNKKRNLFFFRSYEDQYASVINLEWKLIKYHSGKYELFNIKKDPSESKNLIGENLKQEKQLKKDLQKWENEVLKK